ncbi:helix-turn-helix domain-containing protein [Streptomyces aureocirculatus]|uniref:helix-turn-helix domain-containing protein n=1 Tax=Streptomyces aureocirculatus TaxID=67275 RepID=UPI0012FEEAE8|nr:helix-turn-helix transcriptional regulator [Streptomyces aureocirculatus]
MVTAKRLQQMRLQAGLSAQQVGVKLHIHYTTITRLESAKIALKWPTVKAMLEVYGVPDAEIEEFRALTEQANRPGWWLSYQDAMSSTAATYVSLEDSASHIRVYAPAAVPALLQTADYARGVLRLNRPQPTAAQLEHRVALRMERQAVLSRSDPPRTWFLIDETVLRRHVGNDPSVMLPQVEHLIEATYLPNVALQVLPFSRGIPPGAAGGPFTIFRFPLPDFPDIVWIEGIDSAHHTNDLSRVSLHSEVRDRMAAQALRVEETKGFLETVLKELGR